MKTYPVQRHIGSGHWVADTPIRASNASDAVTLLAVRARLNGVCLDDYRVRGPLVRSGK